MNWKRIARAARWLLPVLAVELIYVVVTNAILFAGVIQSAASAQPEKVELAWSRAYSPWPGRAYVWGLRLRVQDSAQQFRLTVDSARLDVDFWALLHKKFHASHIRAQGVTWRMLVKVASTAGQERRVAAFPPIEGFARPALQQASSPPTQADLDALWTAELEDVDAALTELWLLEYRYHGAARVHGGFELVPMRRLWVGPVLLHLDGGELSAGEHVLSSGLTARMALTMAPVDLPSSPGLRVLHTLTTAIHFDTALEDLGVADLYLDGLRARGAGRLAADLQIAGGKLIPTSSLEAWLSGADVQVEDYGFKGDAHAKLSAEGDAQAPVVHATMSGALSVPLPGKKAVVADLSDVTAKLVLVDGDVSRGLRLQHLGAVLGEARVHDARAVTSAVGSVVPLIGPLVMGDGPLVLSATAYVTPEYSLVRLKHLQQGAAAFEGAAVDSANGWNGAAAGHFGPVPLGLRLRDSKLETVPFASFPWLGVELLKLGIKPEQPAAPGNGRGGSPLPALTLSGVTHRSD